MEIVKCTKCNGSNITVVLVDFDTQEHNFVCLDCGNSFPSDDRVENFE